MPILIDTSVLGRLANTSDLRYPTAIKALAELHRRGESLLMTPQNITEFWAVATRPVAVNGLGLSAIATKLEVDKFRAMFPVVDETPAIFPVWLSIVEALGILGKQVHDARLVSFCHVHGIDKILTFNLTHFARLVTFGPGLVVLDPASF